MPVSPSSTEPVRSAASAGPETRVRRIRVMHVVDRLGLAGMEYGVIKQVNRLDSRRFFPMICCLRWRAEATGSLLDARVPVFELHKKSGKSPQVISQLADLFRRESVDIVHSHNWPTFLLAVAAAALARVSATIQHHMFRCV